MDFDRLNELVTKTAKALYNDEEFIVGVLAVRANKAAQVCPTDQTLVGMANFLSKRANISSLITRAELKDVYNKLYVPNNKFASVFSDELGEKETIRPKATIARDPNEGSSSLVDSAYAKLADPLLSNALSNIFDKNATLKLYSSATAESAQKSCAFELNRCGTPAKTIDVVAGQADILLCQATYETPKGVSRLLIPVEIKQEKALLPTMFLSQAGFVDLQSNLIKEHLVSTAGKSYKVDVKKVLEVLASAKNGVLETVSEVERIVIKTASVRGTPSSHDSNGILYQQIDNPILDVQEVKYEQPQEVQDFATRLSSSAGIAEFTLGKNAVNLGRSLVSGLLSRFGYKNAQIAVANSDENTIVYAVAIESGSGFKVPVKIDKRGNMQEPNVVIANGQLCDFTRSGISELLSKESAKDTRAAVMASPMYDLKPAELIAQIKEAMQTDNYHKAEDALDILKLSNDDKAFRVGYELYTQGLATNKSLTKEASAKDQQCCSRQYKTANSKYVICGHTNLPVHKVYQDKNGDCQPLYRKDMSETSSGGSFLHSRIYLG
jgi:hypothetical protein